MLTASHCDASILQFCIEKTGKIMDQFWIALEVDENPLHYMFGLIGDVSSSRRCRQIFGIEIVECRAPARHCHSGKPEYEQQGGKLPNSALPQRALLRRQPESPSEQDANPEPAQYSAKMARIARPFRDMSPEQFDAHQENNPEKKISNIAPGKVGSGKAQQGDQHPGLSIDCAGSSGG